MVRSLFTDKSVFPFLKPVQVPNCPATAQPQPVVEDYTCWHSQVAAFLRSREWKAWVCKWTGENRPNLAQCHICDFGLRRIWLDLGPELRLWWPASQGCHHHHLQQLTDNSPNPLDKYNKTFKQLQRRLWVIVGAAAPNPEEEPTESMFIKNTTHHQLLSHWLLHPQFQHLVMRDTSLGRRRRMWRRGGNGWQLRKRKMVHFPVA